jgi:hypothetical protein
MQMDRQVPQAPHVATAPQGAAWGGGGSNLCGNQAATTVTPITNFRRF